MDFTNLGINFNINNIKYLKRFFYDALIFIYNIN